MGESKTNQPLSRGQWTLARYLAERSPAPMPPVARAGDDALHVAKLTVSAPLPHAVYVVDEEDRFLGTIPDGRLAREVFEHLDPGSHLDKHPYATRPLLRLREDAAKLTAGDLMLKAPQPISDQKTVASAMRLLGESESDELPVTNAAGQLVGIIRALDILREWVEDTLLVQLGDETESFY